MSKKLYLIDGYGIIYKSYFAFLRNPVYNEKGQNVGALLGFFRSLFSLIKKENPEYLAVAMDAPWPTFRHDIYKEYKANRDETPQDLRSQIEPIWDIIKALGIPVMQLQGYEADDIIGTFAQRAHDAGWKVGILSSDKDLLQLVNDSISVLKSDKGTLRELDSEAVLEDRGVKPDQIVDYLALIGDSSDNVPGVAGIGPKTAVKLLSQYNSLDGIYENLDNISSKAQKQKLLDNKEMAYFSQKLVTIERQVPLEQRMEDLQIKSADNEKVLSLFRDYGLNSLADNFSRMSGEESPEPLSEPELDSYSPEKVNYELVQDELSLINWLDKASNSLFLSLDTETDSVNPMVANLAGISLSILPNEACYIPVKAPEGEKVLSEEILKKHLLPFFENRKAKLVGQNLKYDKKVLLNWGLDIGPVYFDTMVAAWVLETAGQYGLDYLAQRYLKYKMISFKETVPKGMLFPDITLDVALPYAAEDADITLRLFKILKPLIDKAGMSDLFYNLEMPLLDVLIKMERKGISLDGAALANYSKELAEDLDRIEKEVYSLTGREFNMQSPKQLQQVLFEDRKLPPQKKTKTGYSTDTSVLEFLSALDPVPAQILEFRGLSKLKSTYVDRLPQDINPRTDRIHSSFIITGTSTGRLSSKDPNLQNIPIRDERGRRIRTSFYAPEGYKLLSADYSQIELVMLAHLSGDPGFLQAFNEGKDIHRRTAARIFECSEEEVDDSQRRIAKTINFGVIYGMSAFRLSNELKIPRKEAARFIESYFSEYSGVEGFIKKSLDQAEKDGGVYTMAGRFRAIPSINSRNKTERSGAQRMAVNTIIQGSAADMVKKAMLTLDKHISENYQDLHMLLQVHDEFIFEVPSDLINRFQPELVKIMESVEKLKVPLRVNCESGQNWGVIH